MREKQLRAVYASNVVIVVLVAAAWVIMSFFGAEGTLASRGFGNLKYFTVLSNILAGAASAALLVCLARVRRGAAERVPHSVYLLKFVAAAAVSVTFLVVSVFFSPWIGWLPMYRGANFWFHLVIPVLAVCEFVFLDRFDTASRRETLMCMLPPLIYGCVYAVNVIANGAGGGPDGNDFYGFAHWGLPVGFGIFAAILLTSWGAGALMRLGNRGKSRSKTE